MLWWLDYGLSYVIIFHVKKLKRSHGNLERNTGIFLSNEAFEHSKSGKSCNVIFSFLIDEF